MTQRENRHAASVVTVLADMGPKEWRISQVGNIVYIIDETDTEFMMTTKEMVSSDGRGVDFYDTELRDRARSADDFVEDSARFGPHEAGVVISDAFGRIGETGDSGNPSPWFEPSEEFPSDDSRSE